MNLKLIYFILRTLVAFSLLFLSFARLPSLVTLALAYLPFDKFSLPPQAQCVILRLALQGEVTLLYNTMWWVAC